MFLCEISDCYEINVALVEENKRKKDLLTHENNKNTQELAWKLWRYIYINEKAFIIGLAFEWSISLGQNDVSQSSGTKVGIEGQVTGSEEVRFTRVSNAQVLWQIEALCRDNGEFISGPAGATM